MSTVENNPYWTGKHEASLSRIELVRSAVPYPDEGAIRTHASALCDWLDGFDRSRLFLMYDLRKIAGRNDPGFEAALAPFRRRILLGFRRAALIVASPAGRLHVQRLARGDETEIGVFLSTAEAEAFLNSVPPSVPC